MPEEYLLNLYTECTVFSQIYTNLSNVLDHCLV